MTTPAPDIAAFLREVEAAHGVRVLFACESGSRAWGFPSRDSDYDVRFIYVHRMDWYLSVDADARRDVLEFPGHDPIDASGWEIRKALRLFARSNPSLLEWLGSPIVYFERLDFAARLRALLPIYFSLQASVRHYLSIALRHGAEMQRDQIRAKRYFYVLRPLLAVRWLLARRGVVPTLFDDLLVTIEDDAALVEAIEALRERKRAGEELGLEPATPVISDFLRAELARHADLHRAPRTENPPMEPLDRLFREMLDRAWG